MQLGKGKGSVLFSRAKGSNIVSSLIVYSVSLKLRLRLRLRSSIMQEGNWNNPTTMPDLQISPAGPHGGSPGKDQQAAGVGILLQIMMLVLSFILGHVLRRHRFYYLPEASASLLIGKPCSYNPVFLLYSSCFSSISLILLPFLYLQQFPCDFVQT